MDGDPSARSVVCVVMDTVRKDHLSVYGYDRPTSPALEQFSSDAMVYEQAVAPAPWTLPVHASLFTGLYPSDHGATQERPYLEGSRTLAETLSANGYETMCYSSNAWITPYTQLTRGFDVQDNFFEVMPGDLLSGPLARLWKALNDSESLRSLANGIVNVGNVAHEYLANGSRADSKTPAIIDETIEFIDDTDGPYFAFCNLMDAHLPYHPPESYQSEFAAGIDSTAVCQNSKAYNAGARSVSEDEWNAIRGLYDAEIRHVDAEVGRLLQWLRQAGEYEDTLIIICADHGELHGEHELYGHEFAVYDPLVNVPLLVKQPGTPGGRSRQQVELLDLYHTILDYTDASVPAAQEGSQVPLDRSRSLCPTPDDSDDGGAAGDSRREEAFAFVEYFRPVVELNQLRQKATAAGISLDEQSRFFSRMRAARRPDAKYIRYDRIPDEAFLLEDDPRERSNVADADHDSLDDAREALRAFEGRTSSGSASGDTGREQAGVEQMSQAARNRLQELGYIE